MMVALITVCVIIAAGALGICFWPLLRSHQSELQSPGDFQLYQKLIQERERLILNLSDLDMDLKTQKISSSDYEVLKKDLMLELSKAYSDIQQMEQTHPILSQILAEMREIPL